MQIPTSQSPRPDPVPGEPRRLFGARPWLWVGLLLVGSFGAGAWVHDQGVLGTTLVEIRNYSNLPLVQWVQGITSPSSRLVIDLRHMDLEKLAYNRQVALERGRLLPDARDEVQATVRTGEETVPVRMRLKGDLPDHWRDPHKWSFRIKTRGDQTIDGMKEFSIQHPRTRDYMNDWFLHRFLKYLGHVALRYDFVEVTLNGRNLGVYAREEHFDKRLVEHNRQREGVLFRADTRYYWYERPGSPDVLYGTRLQPFQTQAGQRDTSFQRSFALARTLFEEFRAGDRPAREVFDLEQFATLFAVLDLLGHHHAAHLDNLVFYFNPVVGRIAPVAADNQHVGPATTLLGAHRRASLVPTMAEQPAADWFDRIFADPEFLAEYLRAVRRLSDPGVLDEFFAATHDEYEAQLRILHRGFPWYRFEPARQQIYSNQRFLREYLSPIKSFHAYYAGYDDTHRQVLLDAVPVHGLPAVVEAARVGGIEWPLEEPLWIGPHDSAHPLAPVTVRVPLPDGAVWADSLVEGLTLVYHLPGLDSLYAEGVLAWRESAEWALRNDPARAPSNVASFPFLAVDPVDQAILIPPGRWTIDRDLILPAKSLVSAGPGTELDLVQGACLYSHSALRWIGSEESPIRVFSSDSTGQGVVVLSAADTSRLRSVHFDNLGSPLRSAWSLTGAVTFYQSPVEFVSCSFSGNRCEDGLNTIRSHFRLLDCVFQRTQSDAFDADWCEGSIEGGEFLACGNDGIDISGSVVQVRDLLIEGSGDKAISVGEQSRMHAARVIIRDAEIAAASKDLSLLQLEDAEIANCRVGFTVFRKKPEFGPASIEATRIRLHGVERPYLLEHGSSMWIDGAAQPADLVGVEGLLYGAEYGKASR